MPGGVTLEDGDVEATAAQLVGGIEAHDAGADDEDVAGHQRGPPGGSPRDPSPTLGMPSLYGSSASRTSHASAVTQARPVTTGTTRPSGNGA